MRERYRPVPKPRGRFSFGRSATAALRDKQQSAEAAREPPAKKSITYHLEHRCHPPLGQRIATAPVALRRSSVEQSTRWAVGTRDAKRGAKVSDGLLRVAPGRTRTCDPLLRRGEHLLRSTAACRSIRSTSDGPHIAAAFCCGLPLPQRFHVDPPTLTQSDSEVSELAHTCFSSVAAAVRSPGRRPLVGKAAAPTPRLVVGSPSCSRSSSLHPQRRTRWRQRNAGWCLGAGLRYGGDRPIVAGEPELLVKAVR